jgi:hypothetical protein
MARAAYAFVLHHTVDGTLLLQPRGPEITPAPDASPDDVHLGPTLGFDGKPLAELRRLRFNDIGDIPAF